MKLALIVTLIAAAATAAALLNIAHAGICPWGIC